MDDILEKINVKIRNGKVIHKFKSKRKGLTQALGEGGAAHESDGAQDDSFEVIEVKEIGKAKESKTMSSYIERILKTGQNSVDRKSEPKMDCSPTSDPDSGSKRKDAKHSFPSPRSLLKKGNEDFKQSLSEESRHTSKLASKLNTSLDNNFISKLKRSKARESPVEDFAYKNTTEKQRSDKKESTHSHQNEQRRLLNKSVDSTSTYLETTFDYSSSEESLNDSFSTKYLVDAFTFASRPKVHSEPSTAQNSLRKKSALKSSRRTDFFFNAESRELDKSIDRLQHHSSSLEKHPKEDSNITETLSTKGRKSVNPVSQYLANPMTDHLYVRPDDIPVPDTPNLTEMMADVEKEWNKLVVQERQHREKRLNSDSGSLCSNINSGELAAEAKEASEIKERSSTSEMLEICNQLKLLGNIAEKLRNKFSSLVKDESSMRNDMAAVQENLATFQSTADSVNERVVKLAAQMVGIEKKASVALEGIQSTHEKALQALKEADRAKKDNAEARIKIETLLLQLSAAGRASSHHSERNSINFANMSTESGGSADPSSVFTFGSQTFPFSKPANSSPQKLSVTFSSPPESSSEIYGRVQRTFDDSSLRCEDPCHQSVASTTYGQARNFKNEFLPKSVLTSNQTKNIFEQSAHSFVQNGSHNFSFSPYKPPPSLTPDRNSLIKSTNKQLTFHFDS